MKNSATNLHVLEESIFAQMTQKAITHKAVNLAQGFPTLGVPLIVKDSFQKALQVDENHQYAPFQGVLSFRQQISLYYKKFYDVTVDAGTEVLVTHGATQAIYLTLMGLIDKGDEVVVFSPHYESYLPALKMLGANIKEYLLTGPDFALEEEKLNTIITSKTKLVIFNNPHNPSGRVFTAKELTFLAQAVRRSGCFLLSDEVYEFLTYGEERHRCMGEFLSLEEGLLICSSMGKTFGVTGHKIGHLISSSILMKKLGLLQQHQTFSVSKLAQMAFTYCLEGLEEYLPSFRQLYGKQRKELMSLLAKNQLDFVIPEGSYFILVDHREFEKKGIKSSSGKELCDILVTKHQLAAIPCHSFYLNSNSSEAQRYIRLCFAKESKTFKEIKILAH